VINGGNSQPNIKTVILPLVLFTHLFTHVA
jgi:hypothetical protein